MPNKKFLFILFLIGIFFRVVNLNWGSPFYFHPDERNIANAVVGLNFPNQMNPHFFAYGSLPIYLIYILSPLSSFFVSDTFSQAIITSRIISSIFSTLLIPLMYIVGKKLAGDKAGTMAAAFSIFSVGFIQFAHFGTFEMFITFFSVLYFFSSLNLAENSNLKWIFITGLLFGILISAKISNAVLILLPILLMVFKEKKLSFRHILVSIQLLTISLLIFIFTNPFSFSDYTSFKRSMMYESSVATGQLPVFYSQIFIKTAPVAYQLSSIFPFLINPFIEFLFLISLFCCFGILAKNRSMNTFALIITFCITFFSQALLLVKWTRYMVPVVPFVLLILSVGIFSYYKKNKKNAILLFYFCLLISFFYCLSFVKTVHLQPDSRIEAASWAGKNISPDARILSEVYDLGIVPFNRYLGNINLINFYDLETLDSSAEKGYYNYLQTKDYIILPSERIYSSRLKNKLSFPKGNKFYTSLFSGALGYKLVYQTDCDIFCSFVFATDKFFQIEQTSKVFDRPTVIIFKNESK